MCRSIIVLTFFIFHFHVALAQQKKVINISDELFTTINQVEVSRIVEDQNGKVHVSGAFSALDTNGIYRLPQFILPINGDSLNYNEDASGFVLFGLKNNGIAFDQNGNRYTCGSVNSNIFISKSDSNLNILWAKKMGHHGGNDLVLKDSVIAIIGQSEDSSGGHTMLVGLINPSGALINSKKLFSGHGFDNGLKALSVVDGYVIVGTDNESIKNRSNIFVVKTDFNLNIQWSQIVSRDNKYHEIEGVKANAFGEIFIAGTLNEPGVKDSIYLVKLDQLGNVFYTKSYHDDDTLDMRVSSMDISNNNVFLGINKYEFPNTIPYVMKLNANGDVLWTKNIISDTSTTEILEALMIKDDSIFITGSYKIRDTTFTPYTTLFAIGTDKDLLGWSCSGEIVMNSTNASYGISDTIYQEPFTGGYVDYPFSFGEVEFNYTEDSCIIEDTTLIIKEDIKKVLTFSNPVRENIVVFGLEKYNDLDFEIINVFGQAIVRYNQNELNNSTMIKPDIKTGIYLINVYHKGEFLQQEKLVVIN